MKTIILALGLATAVSTAAFADSSALDAYMPEQVNAAAVDFTATASTGDVQADIEIRDRLGDGSPQYVK